jgi:hypothetical protein
MAKGWWVVSDEAIKAAVARLLCRLNFDTGAAAHAIDACADAYEEIHRTGGGYRDVRFSMSATSGQRAVAHSPELLETRRKPVLRRKAG